MSYKVANTEIVSIDRVGTFESIYFRYDTYNSADTDGFKEGSNTWFSSTGNASFTRSSVNTFAQYTQAMGINYGYFSGGSTTAAIPSATPTDTIERFAFASTATSASVGTLSIARYSGQGQSSTTHGYTSGGVGSGASVIDRFPFVASTNATDVGTLAEKRGQGAGHTSDTHGYSSGGQAGAIRSTSERFPFASTPTTASLVGNLTGRYNVSGQSSDTNGYMSGGQSVPGNFSTISRFPFAASSGDATDIGNITSTRFGDTGLSSATHGYTTRNTSPGSMDRFPFASSPVTAAAVGTLTVTRLYPSGTSSVTHGYVSGGSTPGPGTMSNVIDRFPFATSTVTTSDVGDLTASKIGGSGTQY